jgi:Beta-lactamase superfamily domain
MHERMAQPNQGKRRIGQSFSLLVFAAFLLAALPVQAKSGCELVANRLQPAVRLASLNAQIPAFGVTFEFLGHSSFLIRSPGGATAVTDYNGYNRPSVPPHVVTMNIAHTSHWTHDIPAGVVHVLRGWSEGDEPKHYDVTYLDLRVRNVPTNIRDFSGATRMNGNSIFIFETGGLCIAHLGHLHHPLTAKRLEEIGQIDVLLVPVDGGFTIGQFDMLEVMRQIKAPINVPMHYFNIATLLRFLDRAKPEFPVHTQQDSVVRLSRADLPPRPQILVLPGN